MEKVYVFCDEFGTSTLKQNDRKNITKFVYSAIIIRESQLENANRVRNEISNQFLQNNPIKSSSKRLQNDNVRLNCLNYLFENLNFITFYLIVDKEKLSQDIGGLRFKEVFYKYFQKIFVSQLASNYIDFEICMHHIINEKYGNDLRKYLSEKVNNSLFETYRFLDDKSEPLIQFADLLAGSLGKCFNKDYHSEANEQIFDVLKTKFSSLRFFPEEQNVDDKPLFSEKLVNDDIFQIVRTDALDIYNKSDDIIKSIVLELLLNQQKIVPFQYVQTYEISAFAKTYYSKEITTEQLRLIVRDLRFNGIIIVSANTKSGYKLAVNEEDIYQYFNHYSNYILPMLKKVQIANEIFMNRTIGEYNPIEKFKELSLLLNNYKFV